MSSLNHCRLDTFDVLIPFDFKTEPSWLSKRYLVNLVSTEVTFFTCGLLFAGVVKEWVWDYAITITLVHIAVTSGSSLLLSFVLSIEPKQSPYVPFTVYLMIRFSILASLAQYNHIKNYFLFIF
uniref:Transmembrane protein 244 n=1 Tax=Callorhinchus milii TaxID=7868 RepID=A0A4W3IDG4_CALMI